jgi:acyl-CoA synthetase (AMP-forming)/AMP-acid ligase II
MEAAVIGVPDAKWIEAVKGVVCLESGHTVTEAELITHCKRQIAGYKCPKSIVFISQLPRSATGKIDKLTLRSWYRQG